MPPLTPQTDTATRRREARRAIRNALGTSHEGAPEAPQAIRAHIELAKLVAMATDGRFTVALIDQRTASFVNPYDALKIARGEVQ